MVNGRLCYIAKMGRQKSCTVLTTWQKSTNHSQEKGQPKILVVSDSESKVSFHSSILPPADQPLFIFATSAVRNAALL